MGNPALASLTANPPRRGGSSSARGGSGGSRGGALEKCIAKLFGGKLECASRN